MLVHTLHHSWEWISFSNCLALLLVIGPLISSGVSFEDEWMLGMSSSRLALSLNKSKLSFHLSPFTQEYHRVHPKRFLSLWCIRHRLYTYLAPKQTLSPNRPKRDSMWHMSSRSSIGVRQNGFLSIWYVPCKPCTYLASRLALFPNRSNQPSTWASSPRIIIRCFHNGFWAYGALGANHAPILHLN